MNGLKIALLTAATLLLAFFLIDQWRRPEQMGALNKSFQDMAEASRSQTEELRKLRTAIENRPVQVTVQAPATQAAPATGGAVVQTQQKAPAQTGTAAAPAQASATVTTQVLDGVPRLDTEFLIPLDRSYINPSHMGGTLRMFSSSPKGLNPIIDNDAFASEINSYCNDSLAVRTPAAPEKYSAQLAESAIISDDYKVYTFRIRQGVRWQVPVLADKPEFAWLRTERELTSEDFAFGVRLILDPKVDCEQLRGYYQDLDRIETPDRYTLRLVWKKKIYNSLSASLDLTPLPKHIYASNRDGTPIPDDQVGVVFNKHWFDEERGVCGVGDFMMTEFVPDKVLRLRRNPTYWTTPSMHFDGVEYNFEVKQDDAKLVAFKNGQVHLSVLPPLKYKSEIIDRKEPRFAPVDPADPKAGRAGELGWEACKRLAFSYLGWNCRRGLFGDVRTRQAMSHAFPKERIIRDVFMGLGQPILSDVHPDSAAYDKTLVPYAYDLAKAKSLLTEAGWSDADGDGLLDKEINGKRVEFRFEIKYYANSPEYDNALAIYRTELKSIGIDLQAKPLEWKELIRVYEDRDFDAIVGSWQMTFDLDFYQLWHSSQIDAPGGSNHCGIADAEIDALASGLRDEFDNDKRIAIIHRIQQRLHQLQPYTFFMSPKSIFVWQNRAPEGAPDAERYLDGVTWGLDNLHPLKNRNPQTWFFPR